MPDSTTTWRLLVRKPGQTLGSHRLRIPFDANIIETGTDPYRLAQTKAQAERADAH